MMPASQTRGSATLHAAPSLLSSQWFRVARLRPRLDAAAQVRRMVVRGEVWHALVRADGTRSFRMNGAAWSLFGRCDGSLPLQRLWEIALREAGDAAPTQDEVLDGIARLQAAGFLSVDRPADFGDRSDDAAGAAAPEADAGEARQTLLAWRLRLGRPDALLAAIARALQPMLRWPVLPQVLAAALLLAAGVGALHADELRAATSSLLGAPRGVWLVAAVYPAVKLLHEAAHGVVARLHGVPVPAWGVAFLMFAPVPYVDASAAAALPRAGQRLAVAAAGIVVELALAAVAMGVVLLVQPGFVRDVALAVFVVGVFSTLAVNANPLLRFDGYHMLCDAAQLPNLATRSRRWCWQQLRAAVLRTAEPRPLVPARGEAPWLWAYAPLSLLMRWIVSLAVLAWLAGVSPWVAAAVALPLAWLLLVRPCVQAWQLWQGSGAPAARRRQVARRLAMVAIAAVLLVGVLPWPYRTTVQGVWWQPEDNLVRTGVDGFVAEVVAGHGQAVQAGDVLLRLHTPAVEAERARLAARVEALRSEQWQALRDDPPRAVQLEHELAATRAELQRAQAQLDSRLVRSSTAGRVALAGEADLPGRWLPRGSLVAHLATGSPPVVQAAVPNEDVALVAAASPRVQIRRADPRAPALVARWDGLLSGAGSPLPSPALGERSGGSLATDPADAQGLKPLRAVAVAQLRLEPGQAAATGERIGERVWVRFDHGHEPLAGQAARAIRQTLLRHLQPDPRR